MCCRRFGFEILGLEDKTFANPSSKRYRPGLANCVIAISHPELGDRFLYCDGAAGLLFTENETNNRRLFQGLNPTPYVKDGFNDYLVHCQEGAINPQNIGTKAAADYRIAVEPGQSQIIRLRLSDLTPRPMQEHESRLAPFGT